MASSFRKIASILLIVSICVVHRVTASPDGRIDTLMPRESAVLYKRLPNVPITSYNGQQYSIGDLSTEKPILLVFAFTRCVGVCTPLLCQLKEAVEKVKGVGSTYRVVVVSFDSADTPEDLAAYAHRIGVVDGRGWIFAKAEQSLLPSLLRTTGFWYSSIEGTDQFDHPAMIIGIRKGRIVRVHVGARISTSDIRAIIREMKGEPVLAYPLPTGKLLFRCYGYDPDTETIILELGSLLMIIPTILGVVLVWIVFSRKT